MRVGSVPGRSADGDAFRVANREPILRDALPASGCPIVIAYFYPWHGRCIGAFQTTRNTAMRIFSIDDDMDRDGMIEMKPAFDDLVTSVIESVVIF